MDLAFELHDLVLTMDARAAAILRPLGMTLRQHTALVIIGRHPGLRGRDLAHGLGVTPAATTGIVAGLVRSRWVEDRTPPGGGNRQSLQLTPAGECQVVRSTEALGASFDDVVRASGHDPEDLALALREITTTLRAR